MPYQSVGDFSVDVMMNQFDLSDWNYDDDSDLSLFTRSNVVREAHTRLISLSAVCLSACPSVCHEYQNMKIFHIGIKIRVSTWSFLSVIHPL
jgi:hypothetical protein